MRGLRGTRSLRSKMITSSINRRVYAASVIVAFFNGIALAATVARDLVIAFRFGTEDIVDAFFIGLLLPSIAVNLTAATLVTAAVPQVIRLRQAAPEEAREFSGMLQAIGLTIFAVTFGLLAIAHTPILSLLASGFSGPKADLTRFFYLAMLPSILLQGWSTLVGALINAMERFALVAAAPALRPLLVAGPLLMAPTWDPGYVLAAGYLAGALLEAVIVALVAIRLGIPVWPRRSGTNSSVRIVLREYGAVSMGSGILASSQIATQYLATLLAAGSVAALSYGGKMMALVLGLGAVPLAAVVLPQFSNQAGQGDWKGMRTAYLQWSGLILAMAVPLTMAFFAYSTPIVRLLFERGEFSAADTVRVGEIQSFLVLQIPFHFIGLLSVRALAALQLNRLVALIAVVNASISFAGSLLLMRSLGPAGIALAISLGNAAAGTLAATLVLIELRRRGA